MRLRARVAAPNVVAEARGVAGLVRVRDVGAYRELVFVTDDDAREMVQARVLRREPRVSDLAYTDGLHLAVLGCAPAVKNAAPRRALALGGGPLTVPRQIVALHADIEIAVVEIDAEVIALAREHFGLRDEPRLDVQIADGREALDNTPLASLDALVVDAFGLGTVPRALASEAFFRACHARLRDGGCLVVNLAGTPDGARGVGLRRIHRGIVAAFGAPAVAAFGVPLPGELQRPSAPLVGARNTIALARKNGAAPTPAELASSFGALDPSLAPRMLPHLRAILARPTAVDSSGVDPWAEGESTSLPIR